MAGILRDYVQVRMSLSNTDCICCPHVFNKNSSGRLSLLEVYFHNVFCQATQQEAEVAITSPLTVRRNQTTAVSPSFLYTPSRRLERDAKKSHKVGEAEVAK